MTRKFGMFCVCIFLLISISVMSTTYANAMEEASSELAQSEIDAINEFVERSMAKGRIPGVALIIVGGDEVVYSNGFGYVDLRNKKTVNMDAVFELGSNSKAFTGLAILKLEQAGLIDLNAPITQYIPWLEMYYSGEIVTVTVAQVMSHTSGIPFSSIDRIPESIAEEALEETVRTLVGTELQTLPGELFSYATINYNILGLIVELQSGQSFEAYITESILIPMGLRHTHMFRADAGPEMANGHKIGFLRAREFDAPTYRGNTPAGYILSSGNDIAIWMMTQLGFNDESVFDLDLIKRSHEFGKPLQQGSHLSYTAGWFVNKLTGEVSHGGNNPNFSSSIILDIESGIGIAVLANLNSPFTEEIAINVGTIIQGAEPRVHQISDMNLELDRVATVVICISVVVIGLMIVLVGRLIMQIKNQRRCFAAPSLKGIISIGVSVAFLMALVFVVLQLPNMFFDGIGWRTAIVWSPTTLLFAVLFGATVVSLICLYLLADFLYRQKEKIPFFFTIFVSIAAGLGNALIVFMINEALRGEVGLQINLLIMFALGITLYAGGSRIVRVKLIKTTNHMVYKLRMDIINKILSTPLEHVESLDDGVIQATLNNDTEVVATFPNTIIGVITACTTVIACFIYLGFISLLTLLACIITIAIIASIYFSVVNSANRLLEEARTTQNTFFKFINDMTKGFKELRLNMKRRRAFESDVNELSEFYKKKTARAFLSFADAFVVGELVFTLAIGFIVFIFPTIFLNIQPMDLRSYVFILLFLVGPVNGILSSIPNLIRVKVAWGRVNKLFDEISKIAEKEVSIEENEEITKVTLTLKDVTYEYSAENDEPFKIGPISYEFNSGEVVFITGGNGSGKSTLAKIITGLYRAKSGEILLNGHLISAGELEQKFSAIFVDFHLFDKIYGIDYETKREDIQKYMEIMQLSDKTKLQDGCFSTTELSTGQKKRLALTISYTEDRPCYLFDEWAADQDQDFKEFFYKKLLPELAQRGKCVIVISHDDRYFDAADKIIKMEWGQIVPHKIDAVMQSSSRSR